MFSRFTKQISRPKAGLVLALLMLFAPALIATTVESAQRRNAKPTPTPKKKATPTPKTQAKSKPTPKPTPSKNSKTSAKNTDRNASKNKTANTKNDRKTNEKDKNAKNSKTSKTTAANSKTSSKTDKNAKTAKTDKNSKTDRNSKTDKNAKTSDKNKNTTSKNAKSTTADKNRSDRTSPKNTKSTTAKTTPKNTADTRPKTDRTSKSTDRTPVRTDSTVTPELPQIIVTTFSVPIKSQARADASTVSHARLGTVLKVSDKNPAWYKVQYTAAGKTATGWISANATSDLNASTRTEIYRQIVERNYKPQMDFASASEMYEFISKVDGELDNSDKSAEIELKRLLALRSALKTIDPGQKESSPYKEFLKQQDKEIVYNEPAGQFIVVSNQFWNLHDKYKKSTVSDAIAWEAANNPLPGECEGYVNCYLFDMRMRFGEYLNLHPNGKNSAEALRNITDYLSPIVADSKQKTVYNGPTDVTDRAEFNNLIAELRTIIARLPYVEKEKTLQQLRQIAEAYR